MNDFSVKRDNGALRCQHFNMKVAFGNYVLQRQLLSYKHRGALKTTPNECQLIICMTIPSASVGSMENDPFVNIDIVPMSITSQSMLK